MLNTPFTPWPNFSDEEVNAVNAVLKSGKVNYWTGHEGRKFENEFATYTGCKYAVAVANGTLALDLALQSLNIGVGDEVIVTSRTFIASISCVVNAGATPIFVDIDRDTQNITAEFIKEALTEKTKAIICVHLAGWPCEMDDIMELANQNKLFVIEDCAQAHGAKYKGRSVGSIGHIGAWSFCQDKIMTTGGEGGMLTTNDEKLWRKAWAFKDHGKSYAAVYEKEHPPGYRWLHESFGTNWRLTEMQSAIGRIQTALMPQWHNTRMLYANKILSTSKKFEFIHAPDIPAYIEHAFYKCYIFIKPEKLASDWTRDKIIDLFNEKNIPCYSGSCSEVYLEKAFDGKSYKPSQPLKNAKKLGETSLMFLVHPTLTEAEIEQTCLSINEVFTKIADSD